ncbi:gamma carbonic anhydrase family protein [Dokdonella soli]|uniref:Gamma carbonic anhydrase family protein n=1 Tax=Dokdonella soli TaxID=529810 RepID=A0ABP3TQI7_9GAMM
MNNIRGFHGFAPNISPLAYIDLAAQVIGQARIGDESSVWPCAVVRADVHVIRIGARSNIQDGAQLHVTHDAQYTLGGFALTIGDDVSIGHGAVLHGCTVQDACLIGMNAIVLDGVLVKSHSIIGAGAVVTQGKIVGEGELWVGNPARCVHLLSAEQIQQVYCLAKQYVMLQARYRDDLRSGAGVNHEYDRRVLQA